MINNALFTSNSNEWETPQKVYDELNREFDFTLDPSSSEKNHKCDKYFTLSENGLEKSWKGERVFCNPPYGREIVKWIEKGYSEVLSNDCQVVVFLIPARTDTRYFHDYIYNQFEIRFIKGRIKFEKNKISQSSAPFPSMIVIMKRGEVK